jgi:GT2 family glycosyltransferase
VIALVTEDTAMLMRCLRAIAAAATAADSVELVIVANGTPAPALAALEDREDLVLLRSPVNHGFSGGCNLAVRCARGERLVFVNDDVTVSPGWLDALHKALDRDPDVAVAGSKTVLAGNGLQEAGGVLCRDGSTSGVGRGCDPSSAAFSVPRVVDYVSFCCAMVRRSAWSEVGGFDERYFPAYYEDLDLCLTLSERGWKVVYEPTAVVQHAEGGSASRHFRDFVSRRNQAKFVTKWRVALDGYEEPPRTAAGRAVAEERALRRAAVRPWPRRVPGGLAEVTPPIDGAIDDGEARAIAVRHLVAAVEVRDDYIRRLEDEAAARGVRDLARALIGPRLRHVRERLAELGPTDRGSRGRRP